MNRVQGHPGGGQGGEALMPAGGLAVERYLKEHVSKPRTTCRIPPHQPARIPRRAVSPQRRSHKDDIRCVPQFPIEEASGGKG